MEIGSRFCQSAALLAGLQLGLFEALADGPLPVSELAFRIGGDPVPIEILAKALVSSELLEMCGEDVALPIELQPMLTEHGAYFLGPGLTVLAEFVMPAWSALPAAVRGILPSSLSLHERRESGADVAARLTAGSDSFVRPLISRAMSAILDDLDNREICTGMRLGGFEPAAPEAISIGRSDPG